ncbi:MAG: NAD-dependent epimerase/dehydratase family protein, partial [Lentisphaeria bacterium]|nr:NAD-dependent epimerase/dehydratase family protein [Lentisphaeria bacterium]
MKALVTGGGFLGARIAEMLLARGDRVRILGRRPYPHLASRGVDVCRGDVCDVGCVVEACAGVDAVFHTAARAGVWGPAGPYFETNVGGTANVIRGCLENGVSRLLYTSSPSVAIGTTAIEGGQEDAPYPRRYLSPYPASKARAERMVLDANGWEMVPKDPAAYAPDHSEKDVRRLQTCALRPHLIWGPGDPHLVPRLVAAARRGRLRVIG